MFPELEPLMQQKGIARHSLIRSLSDTDEQVYGCALNVVLMQQLISSRKTEI